MGRDGMSDTPRRRGRPKGTGINDGATLRAIAGMLAADSALKPTTAIRKAGVTDPSVVRRLRDKLKALPTRDHHRKIVPTPRRASPPQPASPNTSPALTSPAFRTPGAKAPLPQDTAAHILRDNPPPTLQSSTLSPTTPNATERTPPSPPTTPPPHRPPPSVAPLAPARDPQLEALRLASEAAAAMSRFYLHCVVNAAQINPLTLALRNLTMMSQWLAIMFASASGG